MMIISLGKNTHNLLYCGYTRTKVMDSLYFLLESAQLSQIEAYFRTVVCASRSCTSNDNLLSVSERKAKVL